MFDDELPRDIPQTRAIIVRDMETWLQWCQAHMILSALTGGLVIVRGMCRDSLITTWYYNGTLVHSGLHATWN